MPTISEVFGFYKFKANYMAPLSLLFGRGAMAGPDREITWGDFACCAFYSRLRRYGFSLDLVERICSIVYPEIRKHVDELASNRIASPLVILLMNDRYLALGDKERYDLSDGQKMDILELEAELETMEVSVCFMLSAIMILDGQRFVTEYPEHADDCPFVESPKRTSRSHKS